MNFCSADLALAVNARDVMPAGGRLTIETDAVELTPVDVREYPEVRPAVLLRHRVRDDR